MPFAELHGLRYHYLTAGQGTPLLLLHGFTGSSENWTSHQPAFSEHFTTITPDILGHGQSAAPQNAGRYAIAEAAADLVELLDQLSAEPAHLLGYSMGGRLALFMALHYPIRFRSLTLESASPGLKIASERHARIERDQALADQIESDGIEAFVSYWETLPLWQSQQSLPSHIRERLRQQRLHNSAHGLANSLRGMGTGAQPSLWNQLSQLELPVLLLSGALDEKFTAIGKRMAEQMPNARQVSIADVGHTIHLEAPEAFRRQVLEFLRTNS